MHDLEELACFVPQMSEDELELVKYANTQILISFGTLTFSKYVPYITATLFIARLRLQRYQEIVSQPEHPLGAAE